MTACISTDPTQLTVLWDITTLNANLQKKEVVVEKHIMAIIVKNASSIFVSNVQPNTSAKCPFISRVERPMSISQNSTPRTLKIVKTLLRIKYFPHKFINPKSALLKAPYIGGIIQSLVKNKSNTNGFSLWSLAKSMTML
jgi:hypothetical protein